MAATEANLSMDDPSVDSIQPNLNSLRVFEEGGRKFRFYLTVDGAIVCDRFDSACGRWKPVPMHQASEQEIGEMLTVRGSDPDEEIARAVDKACGKTS
jgi:hypothetical protein